MFGGGVYGGLWAFGDRVPGPGAYLSLTLGRTRKGAHNSMLPPAGEGAGSRRLVIHKPCLWPCAGTW